MSTNIFVQLTNSSGSPAYNILVEFFFDITQAAIATTTTDGLGSSVVVLDPGKYVVRATTPTGVVKNFGTYVVKHIIPKDFSGKEMLNGIQFSHRFQLERYNHSGIGKSTGLSQILRWKIL